jgi:hypothetical protein
MRRIHRMDSRERSIMTQHLDVNRPDEIFLHFLGHDIWHLDFCFKDLEFFLNDVIFFLFGTSFPYRFNKIEKLLA